MATYLFSCLEQSSRDVVPDILSGPISYTCRCAHMQAEDLLEMIACLWVFKLPNFEARGELALGFWRHINPHVTYKKLMLQSYFLARDHFYICDKFAHGPVLAIWSESVLCAHIVCSVANMLACKRSLVVTNITRTCQFKYTENFSSKKMKIFR